MSKGNARQEVKPQTIEVTSPILIDTAALGKKDCTYILHVDDDVCTLEVSKQILSMENNFEIDTATSVDEAFKKMEKHPYDVVVSDYEMPMKNGLEFLKELREQHREIPFILFTGKGREEVVVKALNLGADSYLNKNGSPETVYCELAHAISKTVERKKSRKLLIESESKYRTLVEKSVQGILIVQTSPLRLVFANTPMEKIFGYSPEELKSLSPEGVEGLIYPEDKAFVLKRIENAVHGETADSSAEFRAVRKNGSIIWLEAFSNRIEYMGQQALQSMFLDITERKKAEEIVRKSRERYRELANFLPEIVFEADLTGKITFFSQRAFEIAGFAREDLEKGLNMVSFVVPEERERAIENMKRSLAGEDHGANEYRLLRKNGTTYPAIVRTAPIISENKVNGLRGLVIDITENKKAEEIVGKSEERYRELANSVPEMVFESDLTGKITYISQRAIDFTGFTNEELEGRNMLDFLVPEDRKRAIENMKRSFAGENIGSSEYSLFRKDGTTYPTLVRTSRIISENKVTGLRGLVIEITERKKAEKALQESETHYRLLAEREHVTNEKLNVIGKLTRHDVRNKLTAVKANAYLLKKRVGANPEIANYIAAIEQSVEQTESLLEFSRIYEQIGTEQLKTVDVEECFNEATSFFPDLQNVKVTSECHGFSVMADSLLRQLFYNFIDNSMKHGEKISRIHLHYRKEGNEAKLFYEDDGVGISSANKPRTFNEGFTTGKGTGHGLYLVKRMMEVYGWKIEEAGEEGKGVKFVITIPETNYS